MLGTCLHAATLGNSNSLSCSRRNMFGNSERAVMHADRTGLWVCKKLRQQNNNNYHNCRAALKVIVRSDLRRAPGGE